MEHKNGLEDCYVIKNSKKLQCGYTTGSCAAAAAKAATSMLLLQKKLAEVDLMTPKGILLHLLLEDVSLEKEQAVCAVRKWEELPKKDCGSLWVKQQLIVCQER